MEQRAPQSARIPLVVRILLPPLLSIGLFMIVIYLLILPTMENRIIDTKREMVRELVATAWGTLAAYGALENAGRFTREQAQAGAVEHLRQQRYGPEGKDYFWISNMQPRMIMHPYLPQLEGQDMSNHTDSAGNRMVVAMTRVVREQGAGFVEYIWQWKDNPARAGKKLSYVKGYAPWQWVVGTGIYLEDVRHEVAAVSRKLALVSLGILALVSVLLAYLTRQAFAINAERRKAQNVLRASEESYRSVMTAVPDPVVVYDIKGRVEYINPAFTRFFGWDMAELKGRRVDFVPADSQDDTRVKIQKTIETGFCPAYETRRYNKAGDLLHVSLSAANYRDDTGKPLGIVVNLHDISELKRTEAELEKHRGHLEERVRGRTAELEATLAQVKTLSGLVPICSACKKIRDDHGFWNQIETYIEKHSEALFSHGLCPDCSHAMYKDQAWYKKKMGNPEGTG